MLLKRDNMTNLKLLLKLWCYVRVNMNNLQLLLKLWCYVRVNMTNLKLLLKLWCYLRVNMNNLQLLLKLWCYLRVNMTNLQLSLKFWCYIKDNMTNLKLLLKFWCYFFFCTWKLNDIPVLLCNSSLCTSYIFKNMTIRYVFISNNILANYFTFQSFDFERTWWWLFQIRGVHTKFDIYVFIIIW
jgi:hypothetical protein